MAFYGVQRQRSQGLKVDGAPTPSITKPTGCILFEDSMISGGQDSPVSYDSSTGIFTISSGQNYLITWFVTVRTGLSDPGVEFSLYEEHYGGQTPVGKKYPSTNSMKTGQVSGSAILQITEGQTCKFGLFNTGIGTVALASYADSEKEVNANITILPYVAGSYSTSYGLIGMNLTMDKTDTTAELAGNAPVMFNVVQNNYENVFGYTQASGEILLKVPGNYLVNWSVNLDGSEDVRFISFSLITGKGITLATFESTLLMQQAYSGFAFITISADDNTFKLVNTCKKYDGTDFAQLTFSKLTNKASLRIIGHS